MQPNIIKAGICSTVSAAVVVSLSGLVPMTANAAPEPAAGTQLAGKTIFLDPGHQGTAHTEDLSRQVDNGRGGTKDCQTTGMTSLNGIPEHTVNWDVSQLVKASLQALGAQVVLSRADDTGWGGCVDDRARAANQSGADVAVSIHADSAGPDQHGFHMIVPELPIPDAIADKAQSGGGRLASSAVRDAYLAAGFSPANYAGVKAGLQTRGDVAGPALTQVPMVFVEMGNGANVDDAARLESREGQLEHAVAIATGVVGFLLNKPIPALAGAPARVPVATTTQVPKRAPAGESTQAPGGNQNGAAEEPSAPPAEDPSVPTEGSTTPPIDAQTPPPPNGNLPSEEASPPNAPVVPAQIPARAPIADPVPVAPVRTAAPGDPPRAAAPQAPSEPSAPTPKKRGTTPKTQSPSEDSEFDLSTLGAPVTAVMTLLMPLAEALGMDESTIPGQLINLVYTLVGMVFGPS
ncbi:N-acetylmuramoyl-L-alanine amidase [Nocardia sp. NPDC058666]|uniref:N-acetylmuramoyl-L-alanine amidase n=1 Tax=Nocardia sp. NPDC058666 TaxID=3346587 RepID=UPI0036538135